MLEFRCIYALDPSKPYSTSFKVLNTLTPASTEETTDNLQQLLEDARGNGYFDPSIITDAVLAGLFALCVGRTLGNNCSTIEVRQTLIIDPVSGENVQRIPGPVWGYSYGPFNDNPLFRLIPNSTVGYEGSCDATAAPVPIKWGLFSGATTSGIPGDTALNRTTWPSVTSVAAVAIYDLCFLLKDLNLGTVSQAAEIDSSFSAVSLPAIARYGTRRS